MNFEVLVRFLPELLLLLHHRVSCRHKRFHALPYKPRLGYSWLVSPSTGSLHSVFVKDCLGRGNVCISWHCTYRGHREFSRSTEVLCKQRIFMIIVIIRGCIRIIHGSSETIVAYFVYQISITILVRQTGSGLHAFPVRLANLDFCPYTAWVQNQCHILGFSYTMRHK